MTRFERWSVWCTTALVAATGIGFGWTKYLTSSGDPFSVISHPLQPVFLKIHILVAPLFLFAIGMVAVRHIWKHFRSGTRWSRKSGITTALTLAPMVATGYLIQVLTDEGWLEAMAIAHIALGLLYLVGLGLHQRFLAKPPPETGGGRRPRRARPGAAHPGAAERPGARRTGRAKRPAAGRKAPARGGHPPPTTTSTAGNDR